MKERSTKQNSGKKRNTAVVIALLLVCVLAIGGTIAYLTSHSQLTNIFTVGEIKPIDPTGPGPGGGEIPEGDRKPDAGKLNGNLYEPHWVKDSKLMPNTNTEKDPYVGVGAGSEPCAVYVYVKNTMTNNNHIYFTINSEWEAVSGYGEMVPGTDNDPKYIGGLFKYIDGLDASKETGKKNVWTTTPLFSNVEVSKDADAPDFKVSGEKDAKVGTITVQAFLHQTMDGENPIDEATVILPAAKKAFSLK